ncbi:MAG: ATP-binding cassette domain-containing protein [Armatimonadetes bacterium]|nr:ATP-binding cassette domain-containing protein [Armatimonadota bacterium]
MSRALAPVLKIHGVSKAFPGVRALSAVDLDVRGGEIHALVGENGAGKSTLVKILSGLYAPDAGEIRLADRTIAHFDPHAAGQLGIAVVHQHLGLFPSLTGLENLFAGDLPTTRGRVDWRRMAVEARALLADLGLELDLRRPVGELSVAERQQIQIARALRRESQVLILDEPTAALGDRESEALFALLQRLRQQGLAIVYISHRLQEVFRLADRITVLRDGAKVATVAATEVDRAQVVGMMVGREVADQIRPRGREPGPVLLQVHDLHVDGAVRGVSLDLRAGEIVGVAGLAGSGREELVRALSGMVRARDGRLVEPGGPARSPSPETARRLGLAYVPGDRVGQSVVTGMNVRENVTLSVLRELSTLGFPRHGDEDTLSRQMVADLDVRAASIEQPLSTLSGGNQQKIAVARRLAETPRVLILEEPTQGVDIAARSAIHEIVRKLADRGVGVLLVSSDLPELLALSDRVAVMREGRVAATFPAAEATAEAVMQAALRVDDGVGADRGTGVSEAVRARRLPMREAVLAGVLVALSVALAVRDPAFASAGNLVGILMNCSYLAICAAGMTAVIVAGGIDVSIGAMLATVCMLLGLMLEAGLPVPIACLCALIVAMAMGALNGTLSTWLRVPAIVATLGTRSIWRGLAMKLTGGDWITELPPSFERIGDGRLLGLPLPLLIAGVALLATAAVLGHTRLGRALYAVGDDRSAAQAAGLRPRRTQFAAFAGLGLLVGLASILYAATNPPIQPNAAPTLEMMAITAVMVGGTNIFGGSGSILGTLLGVLVLGVIANGLTLAKVDDFWAQALQGALILAAVMADILRRRWRRGGAAR